MTDRFEALERLARLRDSGALTLEEFDREKAKLLEVPPAPDPTVKPNTTLWLIGGLCGVVLAVIAGYMVGGAAGRQVERESAPRQTSSPDNAVQPSSQSNTMTLVAPAPVAEPPRINPWVGRYSGRFEGNARGSLTIAERRGGRLRAEIGVGSPSCIGEIDFTSRPSTGNRWEHTFPRDDSGLQCKLTLVRRNDNVEIEEDGCSYYHGFECSFSGTVSR